MLRRQDFYAGFSLHRISKEREIVLKGQLHGTLIFVLEGSIKVMAGCGEPFRLGKSQMFFWDGQEDGILRGVSDSELLLFSFSNLVCYRNKIMFQCLRQQEEHETEKMTVLRVEEPFSSFLKLLALYIEKGMQERFVYESKQQEMFSLLELLYTRHQLLGFFGFLSGKSYDFKVRIMTNFEQVKTVGELADRLGYGLTTFRTRFKKEFGVSAYRWLSEQKSREIIKRMVRNGDEFTKLVDDFGFSSYSHFFKFCKTHYGLAPKVLREKIRQGDRDLLNY